jgi:hypothetical protein
MGMQQTIQKNTPKLLIKNSQDNNGAPYFVSNLSLHNDLQIPFVHEEITLHSKKRKPTHHWAQQPANK